MVTTVHLLVGTAFGVLLKQPILIAPIAFSTHYLLDAIPHYAPKPVKGFKDSGIAGMSVVDLIVKSIEPLVGIVLVAILIGIDPGNLVVPMIIGAFFGWLPDFFVFLEWKHGINRPWPFRNFEIRTHKHTGGLKGMLPQLITAIISVLMTLYLIK